MNNAEPTENTEPTEAGEQAFKHTGTSTVNVSIMKALTSKIQDAL